MFKMIVEREEPNLAPSFQIATISVDHIDYNVNVPSITAYSIVI